MDMTSEVLPPVCMWTYELHFVAQCLLEVYLALAVERRFLLFFMFLINNCLTEIQIFCCFMFIFKLVPSLVSKAEVICCLTHH